MRDGKASVTEKKQTGSAAGLGFDDLLLGGIILLMLTAGGLVLALYLLPSEGLDIPEVQPSIRVARVEDFPIGASRTINWGDQAILVVRSSENEYFALEGVSPVDDCLLHWDQESLRVVSPCEYLVYDLHGNVVTGLTTAPLRRYPMFLRGGAIYVARG